MTDVRIALASCGCGHDGRLGTGSNESTPAVTVLPAFLSQGREVRQMSVGGYHALALTEDGGVYGWGLNEDGQLGLGNTHSSNNSGAASPVRLDFFDSLASRGERVVSLACGGSHSAALTTHGRLYVCGGNADGQLGLGHTDSVRVWTAVVPGEAGGAVVSWGAATHVSCGTAHTLVACTDVVVDAGEGHKGRRLPVAVLACGRGDFGELGVDADPWAAAQARDRRAQRLWATHAARQQQGAVTLEGDHPDQLKANAERFGWKCAKKRREEFFSPSLALVPVAELTGAGAEEEEEEEGGRWAVAAVVAMHLHSLLVLRRGAAEERRYHWGCYYCGEVEGGESSEPRWAADTPAEAAAGACLLAGDEALLCRMRDATVSVRGSGVLGLGDDDSFEQEWRQVPGLARVAAMAGRSHFLFSSEAGDAVWGFGDNLHGQLAAAGDETVLEPRPVLRAGDRVAGSEDRVRRIIGAYAGARHSVFLLELGIGEEEEKKNVP